MGLISIPFSRSRSPWRKNSTMMRSVHCRYNSSVFVGLLRSAQCTMFCRTCGHSHGIAYLKPFVPQSHHPCARNPLGHG